MMHLTPAPTHPCVMAIQAINKYHFLQIFLYATFILCHIFLLMDSSSVDIPNVLNFYLTIFYNHVAILLIFIIHWFLLFKLFVLTVLGTSVWRGKWIQLFWLMNFRSHFFMCANMRNVTKRQLWEQNDHCMVMESIPQVLASYYGRPDLKFLQKYE